MSGIPETAPPPRLAYRVREVAELTGVNEQTLRNLIDSGEVPRLRVGVKVVLVPAWALHSFVATGRWDDPAWRPVPPSAEAAS